MNARPIFEAYQSRLVNLSGRNPSLLLNHLYIKRHFDLTRLIDLAPETYHTLINYFLLGDLETMLLLPSPPQGDLYTLYRTLEDQFKENGQYPLRIATYFAQGRFKDGTKCRAPLGLLSVKLTYKNKAFYLTKMDDKGHDNNDVLLHAMAKCHQITPTDFDLTWINTQYLLPNLLDHYAQNGAPIAVDKASQPSPEDLWDQDWFTPFEAMPAEDYTTIPPGQLTVRPYLILGNFPTANAIFDDYQMLIDQDLDSDGIASLLGVEDEEAPAATDHLRTISPLDTSQEKALQMALTNPYMVLFGPPGTGKSQCITNAISHALSQGQRVLVVSQKKAALEVIYNRLGTLQHKAILINDVTLDKRPFYESISLQLANLEARYGETFHYKNRIQVVAPPDQAAKNQAVEDLGQTINQEIQALDKYYHFLHTPQIAGYSGQSLFLKALRDKGAPLYSEILSPASGLLRSDFDQLLAAPWTQLLDQARGFKHLEIAHPLLPYLLEHLTQKAHNHTLQPDQIQSTLTLALQFEEARHNFQQYIKAYKDLRGSYQGHEASPMPPATDFLETQDPVSIQVLGKSYGYLLGPQIKGIRRLFQTLFARRKLLALENQCKALFETLLTDYKKWLTEAKSAKSNLHSALMALSEIFSKDFLEDLSSSVFQEADPQGLNSSNLVGPAQVDQALHALSTYRRHRDYLAVYSQASRSLLLAICDLEEVPLASELEGYYCKQLLNTLPDVAPYLDLISNHSHRIKRIQDQQNQYRKAVQEAIRCNWDGRFLKTAKAENYRDLERISGLKRRLRPIRHTFHTHTELVLDLFPCILMGPETVSKVLPLQAGLFDAIIFDEASQMLIEEALPAIFRAKKVIVAGDDKQLGPNLAFKAKAGATKYQAGDTWEADPGDLNIDRALSEVSLLDLAKLHYPSTLLQYHYRSRHEALIAFSNQAFYSRQLKTAPPATQTHQNPPIQRILVPDALWSKQVNLNEASAVVDLVHQLLTQNTRQVGESSKGIPTPEPTIGIIAFSQTQRDAIEDALEARMLQDPEFEALLMVQMQREEGLEDASLFVKNIENVQGDERDIIIFSTGYAKNTRGHLTRRFGSLNQAGGEKRLNVAITRAKEKIYLVTSFEPEALNCDGCLHPGPALFKAYLHYARDISCGHIPRQLDVSIPGSSPISSPGTLPDQDQAHVDHQYFVNALAEALIEAGYALNKHLGASDFQVDLVILDPGTDQVLLGILCDISPQIHAQYTKEQDLDRISQLKQRGWQVHRVWSQAWWQDPKGVLADIEAVLKVTISSASPSKM